MLRISHSVDGDTQTVTISGAPSAAGSHIVYAAVVGVFQACTLGLAAIARQYPRHAHYAKTKAPQDSNPAAVTNISDFRPAGSDREC